MFWMHTLSLAPRRGGLDTDHHHSQPTGKGSAHPARNVLARRSGAWGSSWRPARHAVTLGLSAPPRAGVSPSKPGGRRAPSEAHAAAGSPAVTRPRSPQPRATAPGLRGARADRNRVPPPPRPAAGFGAFGVGAARGGPRAPRALTRGPMRGERARGEAPGRADGRAGVLLLCERRRRGSAKVNSVSSSSCRVASFYSDFSPGTRPGRCRCRCRCRSGAARKPVAVTCDPPTRKRRRRHRVPRLLRPAPRSPRRSQVRGPAARAPLEPLGAGEGAGCGARGARGEVEVRGGPRWAPRGLAGGWGQG